jgi:hypothetical protein
MILLTIPSLCFSEVEEEFSGYESGKMMTETRDALLSYELVQEKTTYWGYRLEKILFGDNAEKFLIFSPLITGKVEFKALDLNFYVDTRKEKGGVKYTFNF